MYSNNWVSRFVVCLLYYSVTVWSGWYYNESIYLIYVSLFYKLAHPLMSLCSCVVFLLLQWSPLFIVSWWRNKCWSISRRIWWHNCLVLWLPLQDLFIFFKNSVVLILLMFEFGLYMNLLLFQYYLLGWVWWNNHITLFILCNEFLWQVLQNIDSLNTNINDFLKKT